MKNSEMKTIIRHIDRLTRNLNARGRRRHADDAADNTALDKARANVRWENEKVGRLGNSIVFNSGANDRFAQRNDKRGFEIIKENAKDLLEKECKDVVKHLKTLIKNCDIAINAAIKAQRG